MKETDLTRVHSAAAKRGWSPGASAGIEDPAQDPPWREYLNNTGGGLVEGDVVVIDTTAGQIVTTTTAQDTRPIGVVLDTIDAADVGPVAFQGPVDLVNVVAAVSAGNYGETSATAKKAQDSSTRRQGSFCYFTSSGTSPSAFLFGGAPAAYVSPVSPGGTTLPTDHIHIVNEPFVGDGAQTVFYLANEADLDSVEVFVAGALTQATQDATETDKITFSAAPAAGTHYFAYIAATS